MCHVFHFSCFIRRNGICSSEGDERQGVPCRISVKTARCDVKLKKTKEIEYGAIYLFHILHASVFNAQYCSRDFNSVICTTVAILAQD